MVVLSKFVENLKDLMFDNNLSQKDLAESTGIDRASINRYLKGNCMPNLKGIVKLSDYFNCSVDFLIGKSEENSYTNFSSCPPFSERLRLYLDKYSGKPLSLCKLLGLPDSKFYGWLAGTNFPRIDSVEKLAEYFDCSIDQFLGREN